MAPNTKDCKLNYGFPAAGLYTRDELMIICAAREIEDGDVIIVGQGLPIVAGGLAKSLYSPNVVICTEAGMINFDPYVSPQHIADPCCTRGYSASADLVDMFTRYTGRGYIDMCFLGCAQIDRYGNINTTLIGDYYGDFDVRFPGAGGNPDFLAYAKKTILTMRGGDFVNKLDYFTSPGYLTGGNSRYEAGMPEGTGPHMLITTSGVFRFDKETKEIYLAETFPGITVEEIKKDVPWDLKVATDIHEARAPTEAEVTWIRQFDPISAAGRTNGIGLIARSMGERKKRITARREAQNAAEAEGKRRPHAILPAGANKPASPSTASEAKPATPASELKNPASEPENPASEPKNPTSEPKNPTSEPKNP